MQLINSPADEMFLSVERAMQPERLQRYMPAAGKDKSTAFKLYLWNCVLCEAFFISLHFAEIVCRNAIHSRLQSRLGDRWFDNQLLRNILDVRFREELTSAIANEQTQHGARFTAHHIASALTFAFWQHLMTKRFERLLWSRGVKESFPNAPNRIERQDVHDAIESVRRWRNRIAHHRAIFDKGPTAKHQEAVNLIHWACLDTGSWVSSVSRVPTAISIRPT